MNLLQLSVCSMNKLKRKALLSSNAFLFFVKKLECDVTLRCILKLSEVKRMKQETLTVGQLAKKGHVSVRTLQYYDQIGLMHPSQITETGRRLYRTQDLTTLHQIIALKALGFSLTEIKTQLIFVHEPADVVQLLQQQAEIMSEQIDKLQKSMAAIAELQSEITRENDVNWYKYSQMVQLIQQNSDYYWVMKHLDPSLITHMGKPTSQRLNISPGWWREIFERAIRLEAQGVTADSDAAQALAAKWWTQMMQISGGNEQLLEKMVDFYDSAIEWPQEFKQIQQQAQAFMEQAFLHYIETHDIHLKRRDGE